MTTSTSNLLSGPLGKLRHSYARSPLPKFLSWWGDELRGMLPERIRDALIDRSSELWLEIVGDQIRVYRFQSGNLSEAGQLSLTADRSDVTRLFERLTADQEDGPPTIWLLLESEQILQRRLPFPRAAEENLRRVLGFEMDRQTPFKADQVYFDYRVDPESYAQRQLSVDFVVVTRELAERSLKVTQALGIALHGLSCWQGAAGTGSRHRLDVNLLPDDRRAARVNTRLRTNLVLVAALVLVIALVMSQSLSRREAQLQEMQARINDLRAQAQQVVELRLSLEEAINGANFLSDQKAARPPLTLVMAELTGLLPDDTWLEQLQYRGDTVTVRGQAPQAAPLIPLLQGARTLLNAGFRDAIGTDPRTGLERFHLSAEMRLPEVEDADSSGAG